MQFVITLIFQSMTGSNCAFYGCGVNRKHTVAIFKILSIGATDS